MRSADNKAAGRIDEVLGVLIHKVLRKDRINDILAHILVDLLLCDIRVMLGGNDNRVDSCNLVIVVLDRDLALSVRTKILQGSILADLRQLAAKLVRGGNCERHILRRLVAGISEHHTLVAGTDLLQLIIGHLVLFDFE